MDILLGLAFTAHMGLHGEYNEIHPHVRVESGGAIFGLYYNSVNTLSVYVGNRWEYDGFGLEASLVTGYDNILDPAPMVRVTRDIFPNTTVFISPTIENHNNTANLGVVLGLEVYTQKK